MNEKGEGIKSAQVLSLGPASSLSPVSMSMGSRKPSVWCWKDIDLTEHQSNLSPFCQGRPGFGEIQNLAWRFRGRELLGCQADSPKVVPTGSQALCRDCHEHQSLGQGLASCMHTLNTLGPLPWYLAFQSCGWCERQVGLSPWLGLRLQGSCARYRGLEFQMALPGCTGALLVALEEQEPGEGRMQ